MNREIKKGEPPPPMSDEMKLAIDLVAGVDAIIKDVKGRKQKMPAESNLPVNPLSEDKPANEATEKHE